MPFGAVAILLTPKFGDLKPQVTDHVLGGRNDGLNLGKLALGGDQGTLCGRCAGLRRGKGGAQNINLRGGLQHAEDLPQISRIVQ